MLCAAATLVDITPKRGLELAGYPHAPRHNTGALDPLQASCLFFDDGRQQLAVVGLDTLFFSKKHVQTVRDGVRARIGLPAANLMICASHSHSTPWAAGRLDMDSLLSGAMQDAEYIEELCDKLIHLVVSASRTTFPCSVAFGAARCGREQGVGGNRRDPENGPCDPTVYTLAVRDDAGVVRGMLVNYAVHPTVLHADNCLCSADYPGAIRRRLRERFPHGPMVFTLGAAGDQSTRYFRTGQTYAEVDRIGSALADAAVRAMEGAQTLENPALCTHTAVFDPRLRELPRRSDAEARVAACKARCEALARAGAPYVERQNASVALLGAEDILGYIRMAEAGRPIELVRDELPAQVCLFRIGDFRLLGLPGEVFSELALAIRARSGAEKLIISTLTNGCLPGYCYSAAAAAEGGYEVDTSLLDADAGARLVELSTALITSPC